MSEKDEIELQSAGRAEQSASVVGWWHSHTRTDTSITVEDVDVHARLFGSEAPLALIIKPHKSDPAQVAIYAADRSGLVSTEPCCRFLSGDKVAEAAAPPVETALMVARPAPVEPERPVPIRYAGVPRERPRTQRRKRLARIAAVAFIFLGTAVGTALLRTRPEPDPVRLDLVSSSSGLAIRWNVDASVAVDASSAELSIIDERGHARTLDLQPNEFRSGSLMYDRTSEKLQIRLRVRSRKNEIHDATAHFLGRLQTVEAAPAPAPVPPAKATVSVARDAEVERLKEEITRMRTADLPKPAIVPARMAQLPRPAARSAVPLPQVVGPPSLQVSGVGSPALSVSATPLTLPTAAVPPPKLSSGRAIWTGTLAAGSTLLIDGRRPTMGALTGSLPNRPMRIRVRAADLLDSGLVIYTPSGEERLERPSAANGWNLTTYVPDARRSGSIAVLEAPAQSNGWQRLMIRSSQRTLSALVIDWDELPPQ